MLLNRRRVRPYTTPPRDNAMTTEQAAKLAASIAEGRCENWGSVEIRIRGTDRTLMERLEVDRQDVAPSPACPPSASATVLRSA